MDPDVQSDKAIQTDVVKSQMNDPGSVSHRLPAR